MEWDVGAPWYRPTRVCHVVSGADWGWRNGSAKWPPYWADTVPPVVEVGPGSPTGMTFGYGAKFPAKYQKALFMCDWSYGKMYAVHLAPRGASFTGTLEEFVTATPLALTDVIINQHDGAMYFLIGGRGTQSGLYRVTYAGKESTAPVETKTPLTKEQALRHELETLHLGKHPNAIERIWPYLSIRIASFVMQRERRSSTSRSKAGRSAHWKKRIQKPPSRRCSLSRECITARTSRPAQNSTRRRQRIRPTTTLATRSSRRCSPRSVALIWHISPKLKHSSCFARTRWHSIASVRRAKPIVEKLIKRLDAIYPAPTREQNVMLTELLCYLQAPSAAEKGIKLLEASPTQEGQIDLVRSLRFLETGWTLETRRKLFEWFNRAAAYKGANNFAIFMTELKADALARLSEKDRAALKDVIDAPVPKQVTPLAAAPRPFVKKWTMAELRPLVESKLKGRDFDRGRAMFGAANCFGCHKFVNEGGSVGPELTALAGRFSSADILESILDPDKVISDQYAAIVVQTAGRQGGYRPAREPGRRQNHDQHQHARSGRPGTHQDARTSRN